MSPYSELVGPVKEQGGRRRRNEEEVGGRFRRDEDSPPKLPPKNMKTYQNLNKGSSLEDDFQVISASYILSRFNLKSQHSKQPPVKIPAGLTQHPTLHFRNSRDNLSKNRTELFKPGCGHKECVHCEYEMITEETLKDTKQTNTNLNSSFSLESEAPAPAPPQKNSTEVAPKLPPKPPWLSLPLPPPVNIPPGDITKVSNVSISVSSDSSEQETVIYGKNVKIGRKNSSPETTRETTKYSNIGSDQAETHTRNSPSICSLKSVQFFADSSADLEKLTLRSYLKEMENEKCGLEEKINGCDKLLERFGDRLSIFASVSEIEKYKVHNKDVSKITALMYSLASRMAKYENYLENDKASDSEKLELIDKQEKLKSQLSEAKTLKLMIDKRSQLVGSYISKYFSSDEVSEYKQILSDKVSLIIEFKELEDRLQLSQREFEAL